MIKSVDDSHALKHRRTRSDDLFRRKLKYNDESSKPVEIPDHKNVIPLDVSKAQEEDLIQRNKYKTRTSSAGTLIITEESFSNYYRRRRRRDGSSEKSSNVPNNSTLKKDADEGSTLHSRRGGDPRNLQTTHCEMEQEENRYASTREYNNNVTTKTR